MPQKRKRRKSSRNAELSSLFTFHITKVSTVTEIGGDFWTRLGSSRLKNVNSHRDRGGRGRETQNCRHFFGLVSGLHVSKVSTVTEIGGGRGRETQNCRHFFGLVSGLRVSKVSTVTEIGGVVVAKPRTVVPFGLASGERKGERREEKRETRGERQKEREERREERREKRGEKREEREEKRDERGESRGEWIEEKREERRGERR